MVNDIKEYFAKFGEIDSVEVNSENGTQCGFVEFKLVDGATAALSNGTHRISSYDVTAEAAEPWHQPDQILNALDDDCLRTIFKYFELEDLKNTAKVCNRFKKCSEDAFSKKYKTVYLIADDTDALIDFGKLIRSLNIGKLIRSVNIMCMDHFTDNGPELITLEMINKYTSNKLEELSISGLESSENLINLKEFTNLKQIELKSCTIPNPNELLKVCPKLEILKLFRCSVGDLLDQRCEQLKEFHLVDSTDNFELFNTFIIRNLCITKLKLVSGWKFIWRSIRLIAENLHNLVELELEFSSLLHEIEESTDLETSLQFLSNLSKLKALRLNFGFDGPWSISPLMNALATAQSPLEEILLNNARITDDAIENMSKLKQLNVIQLKEVYGLTNDLVIQLSKELPQLQQFILRESSGKNITATTLKTMIRHSMKLSYIEISEADSLSIDSSDYFSMLETIQNRPDKIRLLITLTGSGDILNVPEETVAQNQEYLLIDENIRSDSDDNFGYRYVARGDSDSNDFDDDYGYRYGYKDERDYNSSPDSDCYRRWAD